MVLTTPTDVWDAVDAGLTPAVRTVLGLPLQRRVLDPQLDPLRNVLVRKVLMGLNLQQLGRLLDCALEVVSNWKDMLSEGTAGTAREFDARIESWLAEVRAVTFLRDELGVQSVAAIPRRRKRKTPDFEVRRGGTVSLAEVKLIRALLDAAEVIEEDLEIAAIRKPDVYSTHIYVLVEAPEDECFSKNNVAARAAVADLVTKIGDAIRKGARSASHRWSDETATHVLTVEIEDSPAFSFIHGAVRPRRISEFERQWIPLYRRKISEKAKQAVAQMGAYEQWQGKAFDEKIVVVYCVEPGAFVLLQDEVATMRRQLVAGLKAIDPAARLFIRT